jgi:hypothetical protein
VNPNNLKQIQVGLWCKNMCPSYPISLLHFIACMPLSILSGHEHVHLKKKELKKDNSVSKRLNQLITRIGGKMSKECQVSLQMYCLFSVCPGVPPCARENDLGISSGALKSGRAKNVARF